MAALAKMGTDSGLTPSPLAKKPILARHQGDVEAQSSIDPYLSTVSFLLHLQSAILMDTLSHGTHPN